MDKSDESPRILRSDTNENFVASELVEGTTYSISVSVVTTIGDSLPSDPVTINTLPSQLTGLSHSKVTPTEITLNWNQYQTRANNR